MSRPDRGADQALRREARAVTSRHARTFSAACRLLPRDVRDDVRLLYLALRRLDDAVDEREPDARERIAAVEAWATAPSPDVPAKGAPAPTVAVGAGDAAGAGLEVRVLARLDARHDLPRDAVLDFCAGMRADLDGDAIDTEADLDRYCQRVAGTVGILMAAVLGVRGDRDEALRAAAALGRAMQRTNVLRDIDEDRAAGRVYLPRTAIERHGGSLEPGARAALVQEQRLRAEAEYREGMAGIVGLARGRLAIRAAAAMYREILREIERRGPRPGRAVVPARRKLLAVVRG